jgi:hypothetical protein
MLEDVFQQARSFLRQNSCFDVSSCRSGKGWKDGPTGDNGLEGGQQRLDLLAQGRQVAAEPGQRRGLGVAVEAAGDLLQDIEATETALRPVVVEGDRRDVEERQHLFSDQDRPFEQVAGGRLRQASALARPTWSCGRAIGGEADRE